MFRSLSDPASFGLPRAGNLLISTTSNGTLGAWHVWPEAAGQLQCSSAPYKAWLLCSAALCFPAKLSNSAAPILAKLKPSETRVSKYYNADTRDCVTKFFILIFFINKQAITVLFLVSLQRQILTQNWIILNQLLSLKQRICII